MRKITESRQIWSASQLMEYIQEIGFLPLLDSGIYGYSAEEVVDDECRYVVFSDGGWDWPLWKWKGPIVQEGSCVYGKFFASKAGFVSLDWWPDFTYDYKMGINTHVSQEAIEESAKYTEDNLITLRDYYRGNMELSWILTAAWYIIQVIDANVDAHFFYYDVGDDLTLQIEPQFNTINEFNLGYGNNIGLSLKLNF